MGADRFREDVEVEVRYSRLVGERNASPRRNAKRI